MPSPRPADLEWAAWPDITDHDMAAWVEHPIRYRYNRCDRCGKRRFFFRLYDVWQKDKNGFGWICADCLIEVIGRMYDRVGVH